MILSKFTVTSHFNCQLRELKQKRDDIRLAQNFWSANKNVGYVRSKIYATEKGLGCFTPPSYMRKFYLL